jgi:hypothetical protein
MYLLFIITCTLAAITLSLSIYAQRNQEYQKRTKGRSLKDYAILVHKTARADTTHMADTRSNSFIT